MKHQTKLYVSGTLFLIFAMFIITFAPPLFKIFKITSVEQHSFIQIEFFFLFMCAGFYCLSLKYYRRQILNIIFSFLYYFLFVKLYPILFF